MRVHRRRSAAAVLLLVGLVAAWLAWAPSGGAQPAAKGQRSGHASSFATMPPLALVLTRARDGESSLHLASGPTLGHGAGVLGPAQAVLDHLPEGSVRAQLLPGTATVVLTAPATKQAEVSFDGGLFVLRAGQPAELLCDRVVHASGPLVTPSGMVLVSRGRPGAVADPTRMRVDELTIDRVDPTSGVAHSIHQFDGFLAFIAGSFGGDVLAYRVGPQGADLVAIAVETAVLKVLLAPLEPFARDFSVDESRARLLWRNRHPTDTRLWVVDELDLRTGARRRLLEDRAFAVAPHVWPDGGFVANPGGRGLRLFGSSDGIEAPLGPGVDLVGAVSGDGRYVALRHTVAGEAPKAFVVDRSTQAVWRVPTPPWVDIAIGGFVETTGGAP